MKVSIVVPVYNAEMYIKKCLDSLLNQTYKNIEIVVVDDGSVDSSYEILKGYKDKILLIRQKNHGVSYSRNKGIQKATGDYIMFVDVDDWIDLDMVEKLYSESENGNIDIIRCGYIREYCDHQEFYSCVNKKIKIKNNKSIIYEKFVNNYDLASPCGQLIKRECIRKKFDDDIIVGEDYLFNLDLYTNSNSFVLLPECYYHYLYNINSATTVIDYKKIKKRCEDSIYVYSKLLDYTNSWQYSSNNIEQLIYYRIIKELNMKLISMFKINDRKDDKKRQLIEIFFDNNDVMCFAKKLKLITIIKKFCIYSLFIVCIKLNLKKLYMLFGNTLYTKIYNIIKKNN